MAKVKTDKQMDWLINRHTEQEQYTPIIWSIVDVDINIIQKKQNILC